MSNVLDYEERRYAAMTLLSPFQALAEKWRDYEIRVRPTSGRPDEYHSGLVKAYKDCADELTELLGKMVVTDELIEKLIDEYRRNAYAGLTLKQSMRAALESALGVTKCAR